MIVNIYHVMRKTSFCMRKNKGKVQLDSFCYIDTTKIILLKNMIFKATSRILRLYSLVCAVQGGNHEQGFSHDVAHIILVVFYRKDSCDYSLM